MVYQLFSVFFVSIYNISFLCCCFFLKCGTGLSILISKSNPSLVTSFAFLSCGYLLSSYHEVWINPFILLLLNNLSDKVPCNQTNVIFITRCDLLYLIL
jgi:hypothetical protein